MPKKQALALKNEFKRVRLEKERKKIDEANEMDQIARQIAEQIKEQ